MCFQETDNVLHLKQLNVTFIIILGSGAKKKYQTSDSVWSCQTSSPPTLTSDLFRIFLSTT